MRDLWERLIESLNSLKTRLGLLALLLAQRMLSPLSSRLLPGTQLYLTVKWWEENPNWFALLLIWQALVLLLIWLMVGLKNPLRLLYIFLEERVWGWKNYKNGWEMAVLWLFAILTILSLYFPDTLSVSLLYLIDDVVFWGLEIAIIFVQDCIVWFIADFWEFPGSWIIESVGKFVWSMLSPSVDSIVHYALNSLWPPLNRLYDDSLPLRTGFIYICDQLIPPIAVPIVEVVLFVIRVILEEEQSYFVQEWKNFLHILDSNLTYFACDFYAWFIVNPARFDSATLARFYDLWFGSFSYDFCFCSLILKGYGRILKNYRSHFWRWLFCMNLFAKNSRGCKFRRGVEIVWVDVPPFAVHIKEPSIGDLDLAAALLREGVNSGGLPLYPRYPSDTDYLFNNNRHLLLRFIVFAKLRDGGELTSAELRSHVFWLGLSIRYLKTIRNDRNWGTLPARRSPYFGFLKRLVPFFL